MKTTFIDYDSYQAVSVDIIKLETEDLPTKYNIIINMFDAEEDELKHVYSIRTGIQEDTVVDCVSALVDIIKAGFFANNKFSDVLNILDADANVLQELSLSETYTLIKETNKVVH